MFEFVEANRAVFPVAVMCRVLGVSTSGYYGWRQRPPSVRALADEVLTEQIHLVHAQSRQTYGYRRIRAELADGHGLAVGPPPGGPPDAPGRNPGRDQAQVPPHDPA